MTTTTIDPGVYSRTRTRAARVRLLEEAKAKAGGDLIEVHAPTVLEGTFRGRLFFDLPRHLLRRVLPIPIGREPGDRGRGANFVHAFFDDEALIDEAASAGLEFIERRGAWIVLSSASHHPQRATKENAEPFTREIPRVLRIIREAERRRLRESPAQAVRAMREEGRRRHSRRGPIGRARLRRAIAWIDAAYKGGNCFRRVLTEVALDSGAAEETLVFGLDIGRTGHVAFKRSEEHVFDVAFEISP